MPTQLLTYYNLLDIQGLDTECVRFIIITVLRNSEYSAVSTAKINEINLHHSLPSR